jgi:phosphate uptake regulator
MKRKVVLHGPSTLTISLPTEWVKQHKIKKGTEINLTIQENDLLVSPNDNTESEKIILNIDNLDRTFVRAYIRSAYHKGYDSITVKYTNPLFLHVRTNTQKEINDIINEEVSQLVGFEIIDIKKGSIELANLTYDKNEDFNKILKKIFLQLSDFCELVINSISENKKIDLRLVQEKHDIIEKFDNYCLRLLNKKYTLPARDERILYHIVSSIDTVNNIFKVFYRDGVYQSPKLHQKTVEFYKHVLTYIVDFRELFYKYENSLVFEMSKKRKKIREELWQISEKVPARDLLLMVELKQIVEILYNLIITVMEFNHKV